MRKLIFFDIDGTIVTKQDGRYVIPDSTRQAVTELRRAGHFCFINSGRALSEMDDTVLSLPMDGYICGCGTHILYHEETLFRHTLPLPLCHRILQVLEACKLEWILEGTQVLYYSASPYTTVLGNFHAEHMAVFPERVRQIEPSQAETPAFDKFCICCTSESNLSRFVDTYRQELDFIDRGGGFYEVVPKGCSKASGIAFLMRYLGIPQEDTIAIGDSTNDLPMLEYAATSIAMGGSPDVVCKAATFVTDDLWHDGLYHAFQRIHLLSDSVL